MRGVKRQTRAPTYNMPVLQHTVLALVAVALMGALAGAQIPSLGFCPDYVPVGDFDMERFLGRWYEAERYFTVSEVASRCVTTEYTRGPSGKIYVSNEITNRLTSVKRVVDGLLDFAGKAGEGSLNVKFNAFPPYDTNYKVLDTDYTTYAVLWSCSGIGPVNTQNAWVYTRERNPSAAALQRAYGVLDKFKISRTFFLKTDQKDCALGGAIEESAAAAATSTAKPLPLPQNEEAESKSAQVLSVAEHILTSAEQVNNDQAIIPVQVVNEQVAVADADESDVQEEHKNVVS